ncbi:MAG: VWA domain-containing protein [Candidatus Aminicenantes bacterium]|nr:VWA domain-containing protein [Candidatus Aminicenantes bacterium]
MKSWGIVSAKVLLLLFFGVSSGYMNPLSGQEIAQLQKPLQHEVAVTLKLIQVYITDKNGKQVTNLDKSEFRVFDNGKLQTITEFERHMAPASKPATEQPVVKETLVTTEITAPRMGRKFFVLIDLDSNDLEGLAKSRSAALHFLDSQALPSDEISVYSYSFMQGLVLHIYLTTDHAKVREAVRRIRDVPGKQSGGTGGADTGTIVTSSGDSGNVRIAVQASTSPSRAFADRMTALAKVLGHIPGYKNILYFSQGSVINGMDGDAVRRLKDMSREFGASNAPFYAVNTETPKPFTQGIGGGELLAFVAELTGGKAYKEIGAVIHFADIAQDIQDLTRNYYVLGFPVQESWDGKYHKIKVEMRSGDYRVQAQAGYYNPKPFRDFSDLEKEIHLFDLALVEKPAAQAPLMFAMRALHFENKEAGRVLMLSKLPAEVMDKFAKKKIELVSLIFDEQDNPVDRKQTKPDLAKYKGADLFYSSEVPLKPGAYRCRIIIRDMDTGEAALAYVRVSVPAKAGSGLSLFSPMLLIAGGNLAYWDMGTKKNTAPWMDLYFYDRSLYSSLTGELAQGTAKIFAVIPFSFAGILPATITFSATLVDSASGKNSRVPLTVLSKFQKGGLEIQFVELSLIVIPSGKYLLYVHAEDDQIDSGKNNSQTHTELN